MLKRHFGSRPPGQLRRLPRACVLAALAFALSIVVLAPEARAALKLGTGIIRDNPHELTEAKFWISKKDCLANEKYTFPLQAEVAEGSLEIWVSSQSSANCASSTDRSGLQQKCYEVSSSQSGTISSNSSFNVYLGAGDVAKALPEVDENCDDSSATDLPRPIVIWFLQVIQGEDPVVSFTKNTDGMVDISVDLIAPDPPDVTGVSVGEGSVSINYNRPVATTQKQLLKYLLFCDPPSGASASAGCDCLKGAGSSGNGSGTGTDTTTTTSTTSSTAATTKPQPPPPPQGSAGPPAPAAARLAHRRAKTSARAATSRRATILRARTATTTAARRPTSRAPRAT